MQKIFYDSIKHWQRMDTSAKDVLHTSLLQYRKLVTNPVYAYLQLFCVTNISFSTLVGIIVSHI